MPRHAKVGDSFINIWLITVGEPLPIDEGNPRLMRTGILAKLLAERGHHVVWWTATFNHNTRTQRAHVDATVNLNGNYSIRMLHAPGYTKTLSLARIVHQYLISQRFRGVATTLAPPDFILCSMPTIELSRVAVEYGLERGVPVVLDIRDLWPDMFLNFFPQLLRSLARLVFLPLFRSVTFACRNAGAIVGSSPSFVDWGLNRASRRATQDDKAFFHGYNEEPPAKEARLRAEMFWDAMGVHEDRDNFIVCFFGRLGRVCELDTVIEAAAIFEEEQEEILFVFCGPTDDFLPYQRLAEENRRLLFPGFLGAAEIWTLMRRASVGLAPYVSTFPPSLPNKPIEYLSAGLPVISTLKGDLAAMLTEYCCGVTYKNGDAEGLARVLGQLRRDPDGLRRMSDNAMRLFHDKFVAGKVYEEMAQHLEGIAARSAGGCRGLQGN